MNTTLHVRATHRLILGRLLILVWAALLGSCALFEPPRPYATEAEAIAARGEPTRRWQNDDGTTTLEYATQPFGDRCLMVQVDQGGKVLRQWDALSEENRAKVEVGMTMAEVDRLLGEHRSVQTFRLSGEEVWDWNVYNDGPGVATLFNVHFIDGKVVRTSRTYVYRNGNGGGMFGGLLFYGHPYGYPFYGSYWPRWPYRYYYPFHPYGWWYGW